MKCTQEKDKALKGTFYYRTFVKNWKHLKEMKTTMHYRVAAVRDFWKKCP